MKHWKLDTTPEISNRMAHISLKGGKSERELSLALWHIGIRYRKNFRRLPGSPDIAITKYKIAIFVDGEFWHGYDWENRKEKLKSNRDYWIEKIEENMARDQRNDNLLLGMGWLPIHFWEKQIKQGLDSCVNKVIDQMQIRFSSEIELCVEENQMKSKETYDKTEPRSIEQYAQKLIGHTFTEVKSWNLSSESKDNHSSYANRARKGGLGNFIEEQFFCYKANSDSVADFSEAGVELKVTPYEKKKNGKLSAGERLVLTMISYEQKVEPDFKKSHLWLKCRLILLIYYLRDRSIDSNMDFRIDYAKLFTPPDKDLDIIMQDYKTIIEKVAAGKADELSESDTNYLGACTKGANALKSTVPQAYYAPDAPARKRAFCFKTSYMTYVLNTYVVPGKDTYESIIKDPKELDTSSLEEFVTKKINNYAGKTDEQLCAMLDREYNNNKAQWSELAFRMLGIKSNKAEEFAKAQIVVKAIRLEENGTMRENSPLPALSFEQLVSEEWEDSELFRYFDETRFLFVVYRKKGDQYVLKGSQIWNMPYDDLNAVVFKGWNQIRNIVKEGVVLTKVEQKNGTVITNNFPKKTDNPIIHIRPHTQQTYYVFEDGTVFGKGRLSDSDELPDGRRMTKQSFWLNNTYIVSQLDDELKSKA